MITSTIRLGKAPFQHVKRCFQKMVCIYLLFLKFPLLLQMIKTSLFGQKKAKFEATGANKEEKLRHLLSEVVGYLQRGKAKNSH
jgi:hypothetical protein